MKKSVVCLLVLLIAVAATAQAQAQTQSDSLKRGVRRYIARNFSEVRTLNLYWETSSSHDYTLLQRGNEIEKGRMSDVNSIKFAVTVPVLLLKKFSLYANGQFSSYQFEATNNEHGGESVLFTRNKNGYNYYEGTVTGTYRTRLGSKPLILTATAFGDGWDKGFEKAQAMFSAISVLKQSRATSFAVGVFGMTLYDKIPVFPLIIYSHQFNPNWNVDLTLPSKAYMRYQFSNSHRFSLGASLGSDHFYLKPEMKDLPEVSFFNKTTIKPEFVYEYIINEHFYLIARTGVSAMINGGVYGTNRKGMDGDPYLKFKEPVTPFLNLGFSYNIFK